MSAIGKILYLTDKIEVGRTTVDPALRRLAFTKEGEAASLDTLFETILKATADWLVERGLTLSDDTIQLLREIGAEI